MTCGLVGRTTEEGFSIYKEDELGITEQGGGAFSLYAIIGIKPTFA